MKQAAGRNPGSATAGVLHLPMATALAALALAGLGLLGIGRYWTAKVGIQLDLDRCTGEAALELRDRILSLEAGNRRIEALRAGVAAALATGNAPVLEAAKTALSIAARAQDLQLLDWRRRQVGWLVRAECGGVKSSPPLPEIPLSRPPPDPLGERPLSWRGPPLRLFSIRAARARRSSASFVFRPQETPESAWTASWRQP